MNKVKTLFFGAFLSIQFSINASTLFGEYIHTKNIRKNANNFSKKTTKKICFNFHTLTLLPVLGIATSHAVSKHNTTFLHSLAYSTAALSALYAISRITTYKYHYNELKKTYRKTNLHLEKRKKILKIYSDYNEKNQKLFDALYRQKNFNLLYKLEKNAFNELQKKIDPIINSIDRDCRENIETINEIDDLLQNISAEIRTPINTLKKTKIPIETRLMHSSTPIKTNNNILFDTFKQYKKCRYLKIKEIELEKKINELEEDDYGTDCELNRWIGTPFKTD